MPIPSWLLILLALLLGVLAWRWGMGRLEAVGRDIWGSRTLYRLDGLNRLYCRHVHRFDPEPIALPEKGGVVLACNHVSGVDPLLLGAATGRPLRFIIAREQYQRFGLRWFFDAVGCIPVDRSNNPEKAFRVALKALREGAVVALFPHGKIHLDSDPPRPLKSGAVRLARLAGVPIVPVRLEGVGGQGMILRAVFVRSHARLLHFRPLLCQEEAVDACGERLAAVLEGRVPSIPHTGGSHVFDQA
jgi:1-acyl-sn-glycerol-3-phosphate acyltransferase